MANREQSSRSNDMLLHTSEQHCPHTSVHNLGKSGRMDSAEKIVGATPKLQQFFKFRSSQLRREPFILLRPVSHLWESAITLSLPGIIPASIIAAQFQKSPASHGLRANLLAPTFMHRSTP